MQTVSSTFTAAVSSSVKKPQYGFLVSWKKNIDPGVHYFRLNHSHLDSSGILKGSGDTITFFDKYDYQDESPWVKNFRITRKFSTRPWGVIMATAEIELNNTNLRFMPGHDPDIGAYVDLPERPVKLKVGYNGEFIDAFVGYADRPVSTLVKRITKITAFDATTYLSSVKSSLPAFVDTPMQDIVEALLIEQGFSPQQFNIEPSLQQPIGYVPVKGRFVTTILQELAEAEGLIIFTDEHGIIQVWNRLHLLGDKPPVWEFDYDNLAEVNQESTSIINSAQVITKPFKPQAWNKLWEMDDPSDQTLVPPHGSIDIFAEFKDDLGNYYAISVDTPTTVALANGSSSYMTNTSKDGDAATNAAAISLSSVYNFGDTYRMTFTNSSDMPTYITRIQLFGQPAKVTAVKTAVQEDQTSIDKYGMNPDNKKETLIIENNLVQDTATANSMAWMLVDLNKKPHSRMDLDNFVVPHLQIGDPIKVNIEETAQEKYCNIMGTELFFGVNANITQSLYVEEREQKMYFRLDTSHLDGYGGAHHLAL